MLNRVVMTDREGQTITSSELFMRIDPYPGLLIGYRDERYRVDAVTVFPILGADDVQWFEVDVTRVTEGVHE